ncbi:MAG: hypothetical protein HON53_00520 [Planctomycetaceae bacterium]|jgi:hypothetical protein|nr:hypothetical protein [Planctomycetaceae bacterium]MBT6154983.1 hypothetical protein [Planctomycetaceae bacterium]MBT6487342.1 hypothetical protein [Planctomycetaceae bacterium]MBT6493056.1 hypothetical protein [Planctomycetaceae bacterium]
MRKPLVALFSCDTRMICELPAEGKGSFRFAVCEGIDEVEEFFDFNRAAAFIADFREAAFGQHEEAFWLGSMSRRFDDMKIVVVTSAEMPASLRRRENIAQIRCDDDRTPTTELLARLIATAI